MWVIEESSISIEQYFISKHAFKIRGSGYYPVTHLRVELGGLNS